MNRTLFVTNKYPYDIKRIYTSYLVLSHFLFLWWKGTCFFLGIKNILIFYLVWVEHCQKIKMSIFWLPTPSSCKWSVWTTPQFGNQGNYQIVIFNKWWFKCWIEYLFLKDKICTLHFEACKHLPYPYPAQTTPSPQCELQLWMIVVHAVVKNIHPKYYKNLKKLLCQAIWANRKWTGFCQSC